MFDEVLGDDRVSMTFRTSAATTASSTCAKPAGVAVGDVVVVIVPDSTGVTLTTSGGAAWTRSQIDWASPSYHSVLFCKVLNATDVSNNWGFSTSVEARALAWIGNDAGIVAVRSTANNAATGQASLALAGFTPSNTQAAIAVVLDRDNDLTPGTPAGFVSRFAATVASFWACKVVDADAYPGGSVTFTGLDAGANDFQEAGWLVEVKQA